MVGVPFTFYSGVAALLSLPTSWLVNRIGKPPVVGAGICCFIVVTCAFAVLPTDGTRAACKAPTSLTLGFL